MGSETQKFGHVTFFWNGNRSGYFDETKETYVEIPSDKCPFNEKPDMKTREITEEQEDRAAADGRGRKEHGSDFAHPGARHGGGGGSRSQGHGQDENGPSKGGHCQHHRHFHQPLRLRGSKRL